MRGSFDCRTEFCQRGIGLVFDGALNLCGIGLQDTLIAPGVRQRRGSARRAPTPPPILDRTETDGKSVRDGGLGHLAVLHRRNNALT